MGKRLLLDWPGRFLYRRGVDLSNELTFVSKLYRVAIVAVIVIAVITISYFLRGPAFLTWLGIYR